MSANNYAFFIGNLTRDPEIREFGNEGGKVASFSIAVSRRTKSDHPEADFFNCEAWNSIATVIEKYFHKGSKIAVMCKVKQDRYEVDGQPRSAIKFVVQDIQFVDKKSDSNSDTVTGSEDDDDFPM